ncbi:MAG: hypothetical protein DRP54_06215 [Spirochaetes bacterium]|nr:MAG: hypothetical protein DRP54_06215 [Spirochaetota bacterium]
MIYSILLTFVGAHDPFNPDGTDGPILSYLGTRSFDKIYLFYNTSEYLSRARDLMKHIRKKHRNTDLEFTEIDVSSPTDYEELFRVMTKKVLQIEKENRDLNPEYFILTDSGTPQMQTCWVLLVASNLFKAHLIQGIPAKFAGGIYRPREINLNFKDFPIVLKPPEIDRLNKILLEEPQLETIQKDNLIGNEKIFITAKLSALQASKYDITVLLLGETGTGKELFAKLIHNNSIRKDKPFVSVNCSAINVQIAESELFGHKKGAFTGALYDKEGFFGAANGGTIFVDEIGDMPRELQPKLLRVLEDGTYIPVGETKERKTDVRVIAATNKDLHNLVKDGKFRRDLFERLNEYTIQLPPLRERRNDIPLLIQYFLNEWNTKYGESKIIQEDLMPFLLSYPWPGNVRELRNAVMHMCAASQTSKITLSSLPYTIVQHFKSIKPPPLPVEIPTGGINLREILNNIEKEYYKRALELANGNKAKAARLIGIEPPAFRKALRDRFKELLQND